MTLDSSVAISENTFTQKIDDEIVLLDTESEEYFGLDASGAVIWHYLSESKSLRGVYESMLAIYDVAPEQLEKDIVTFVQKLADAGLVQLQA